MVDYYYTYLNNEKTQFRDPNYISDIWLDNFNGMQMHQN